MPPLRLKNSQTRRTVRWSWVMMLILAIALCWRPETAASVTLPLTEGPPLRVVTRPLPPLVIEDNGQYQGFVIDLWQEISRRLNVPYAIEAVESVDTLLEAIESNEADIGIGAISITADREKRLNFSQPILESGLQILVYQQNRGLLGQLQRTTLGIVSSPAFYGAIGIFILILLLVAHLIWLLEHRHNPDFPRPYPLGIWDAFWWAAVTVTTVGYGDKTPKRPLGKLVALLWMCAGYFVFGYFIASMTTIFTVDGLQGAIQSVDDLAGRRVATVEASTAADFLANSPTIPVEYADLGQMYQALQRGEVEAIVYDAPILQHYASHEGNPGQLVGGIFERQFYGFALPINSPYLKPINVALLQTIEDGTYERLRELWFGGR